MSNDLIQTRFKGDTIDNLNIDAAGGEVVMHFGGPIRPLRAGFVATTAVVPDGTEHCDVELFRQILAGSESGRVSLGVFRVTPAGVTLAAGSVVYKDFHVDDGDGETAEDGTLRFVAPEAVFDTAATGTKLLNDILIGQAFQAELQASAEATSGDGYFFLEYTELPFAKFFYDGDNVLKDVTQDVSINPNP